jgi:hypothetical protein
MNILPTFSSISMNLNTHNNTDLSLQAFIELYLHCPTNSAIETNMPEFLKFRGDSVERAHRG